MPSQIYPPPTLPRPGYRDPITDPTFGSEVIRVTDPGREVLGVVWNNPARHHYSLSQAWNADGSLLMMDRGTSGNLYMDGRSYVPLFIKKAPGRNRWHPTDPDIQIIISDDGVMRFNPRTGSSTLVTRFPHYTDLSWASKGNPSHDGNMLAPVGKNAAGDDVVFAYDSEKDLKHPDIILPESFSSATISPLGGFIVVWGSDLIDDTSDQTLIFDRTGNQIGAWPERHHPGHYDLAVDQNGDECAIGNSKTDPYKGIVIKRRLVDGLIVPLTQSGYASHTSARNLKLPGWVYVTYPNRDMDKNPPYDTEAIRVKTDGSFEVERLCHTHTCKDGGYYAEAHVSPSPDGKKIVFASNWDDGDGVICSYVATNFDDGNGNGGGNEELEARVTDLERRMNDIEKEVKNLDDRVKQGGLVLSDD